MPDQDIAGSLKIIELQPFNGLALRPVGRCISVTGVSASGKTSLARGVCDGLVGWSFIDADPYHPPVNWQKILDGHSITPEEREVFLAALLSDIRSKTVLGTNVVLSWSALKQEHRERLLAIVPDMRFVYLDIDEETALRRSEVRKAADPSQPGPGIVKNQFENLEVPSEEFAIWLDARRPVAENIAVVLKRLRRERFLEEGEVRTDVTTTGC